jgi:hypothetical protein
MEFLAKRPSSPYAVSGNPGFVVLFFMDSGFKRTGMTFLKNSAQSSKIKEYYFHLTYEGASSILTS